MVTGGVVFDLVDRLIDDDTSNRASAASSSRVAWLLDIIRGFNGGVDCVFAVVGVVVVVAMCGVCIQCCW